MVNSKGIKRLLETVKGNLLFNCSNIDSVKELFLSVVDDNESRFEEFKLTFPKLKKSLEDDLKFFMESDPAANSEQEILLVAVSPAGRVTLVRCLQL